MTNAELEQAIRLAWARLMAMIKHWPDTYYGGYMRETAEKRQDHMSKTFAAELVNYENLLAEQSARAEINSHFCTDQD